VIQAILHVEVAAAYMVEELIRMSGVAMEALDTLMEFQMELLQQV
jgi:hypothetical protein